MNGLKEAGYTVSGGVNSPYVWMKAPNGMTSWEFFDYLLENANVVGTPGSGFGPSGETYFRLTAFGSYENTVEAVDRIKAVSYTHLHTGCGVRRTQSGRGEWNHSGPGQTF